MRAAIPPVGPMRAAIPFVGPSYEARSLNADAQRCVNCYVEMDNASPRAPVALYGTPGLVLVATAGDAPIRGMAMLDDTAIVVAGDTVYAMREDTLALTSLGAISNRTGPIGIASNGSQVIIVDGVGAWLATANTLTAITDPDFPIGVHRAAYQDGYFIVTADGSQRFYINQTPNQGGEWNGLDFASAEGSPDLTVAVVSNHRELWLFGDSSIEVWVNTGNGDFPFERSPNVFIDHGCAAAGSVAKLDNTVFWLGQDDRGGGIVWKAQGYTPARVSNHALEKAIQGYATTSDAIAFSYEQDGHCFYVLTFPTESKTWVYDIATNMWHERAYRLTDGSLIRWRANCYLYLGGRHLVGDFENGRIYELDLDTYTDNGTPIIRIRASQCQHAADSQRVFYSSIQVDMQTGVGLATGQGSAPLLMLRHSDDGGHTWSELRTASVGAIGGFGARARFNRLGSGRNRVWEISMSDPVKFALLGASANFEEGEW